MKFKELTPEAGMEIIIADRRLSYTDAWYDGMVKVDDAVLSWLGETEYRMVPKRGVVTTAEEVEDQLKIGNMLWVLTTVIDFDFGDEYPIQVDGAFNDTVWVSKSAKVIRA